MTTREVSGKVRMLGNATVLRNGLRYSLIEFADGQIVNDVFVLNNIDNFLRRSLDAQQTSLWLRGSRLIGLKIDGKAYLNRAGYQSPILCWIFIAIGLSFSWMLVGIPILWANAVNLQNALAMNEFKALNPNAVEL